MVMDHSSFNSQLWELSSLHQQQILTALADDDHDYQLPDQYYYPDNYQSLSISPTDNHLKPITSSFSCSPSMEASCKINCSERPRKIPKTITWSSSSPEEFLPSNLVPKEEVTMGFLDSMDDAKSWRYQVVQEKGIKRSSSATGLRPGHDDHIIAERKRREKLSQRFIALASNIPGLKKADKASILGDAVKYVKELEETVKSLQDQKSKKTVESAVLVRKSKLSKDDGNNSSLDGSSSVVCSYANENSDGSPSGNSFPEIRVKVAEKAVLVRIHCENKKGVLVKALAEIEKLHLMVTNASVMPFVESFQDITVTAQMEEGFSMTAKDLAQEISSICHQFSLN